MKIVICIGSSCHLKGSRYIVKEIQELIAYENLNEEIELAGTFCMGNCQNGVCVTLDGEIFSIAPNTVKSFFENTVKPRIKIKG